MIYTKKFTEWLIENADAITCCEGKRGWQAQVGISTPIRAYGEPTKAAALIELYKLHTGRKGDSEIMVIRKSRKGSVSVTVSTGDTITLDGREIY